MTGPRAWMIDVYETALTVDFGEVWQGLSDLAEVPLVDFRSAADAHVDQVMTGGLSLGEAFDAALRTCGVVPDATLVTDLVDLDARLLESSCRVFEDVVDFIDERRAAGDRVALVSNCADNTRPLLQALGLSVRVDAIVLSCEAGSAKPSSRIYEAALRALDAAASATTLIDDQLRYCEGAIEVGVAAIRIDRTLPRRLSAPPAPAIPVVSSFDEVLGLKC